MTQALDAPPAGGTPAEPFRYDAFISYRHVEPDREWAQWLHAALETYRVPVKLQQERGLPPRLTRLFRDEEELPASSDLNNEIESALAQSRYLIVVCSPRTPGSLWVNREVERFREMGRHDRILALLIEGEPSQAFPRAMVEIQRSVVDAAGRTTERVEDVEPLAADVRATRHETPRYLKRMARLRVMAILLGCRFDDLRQREQERRQRRLAWLGAVLAGLLVVVGGMAVYAFQQRNVAVAERAIAERARQAADEQRTVAEGERRRAEAELAQGTVLQGDALGQADRWPEAKARYADAARLFGKVGGSSEAARLGLWDAARHVPPPADTLAGHAGPAWAVAVSPDGRRLLSAENEKVLRLWDAATGRTIKVLDGTGPLVRAVAFLPDGNRALSAGGDGTIKLWDLEAGAIARTYRGHGGAVNAVAVAPDGQTFVSASADGTLRRWDVSSGEAFQTYLVGDAPNCVALSPDGGQILCGGSGGRMRYLDAKTGSDVRPLTKVHDFYISGVAFLPDVPPARADGSPATAPAASTAAPAAPARAVSVAYDKRLVVWDLTTGKPAQALRNLTAAFTSVAAVPDERVLTGLWDGTLKLWDLPTGRATYTFVSQTAGMTRGVAVTPDGRLGVSAGDDRMVRVWDLTGGRAARRFEGIGPVPRVAFSADGRTLVAVAGPGPLFWYDVATGKRLHADGKVGVFAISAAVSADGRRALCGGLGDVALWDLAEPAKAPVMLKGHADLVNGVAFTPDGALGVSGSADKTARVWDLATGKERLSVAHDSPVNAVAVSPDGRTAMTVVRSGLRLWDVASGRDVRTLGALAAPDTHSAYTTGAFSADGSMALAGTQGGAVELFDVRTGAAVRTFDGAHAFYVEAVAFSADGRRAASASGDGGVWLWDVATGRRLRALPGHVGKAQSLAFAPDGRSLLSGGWEGDVWLWDFAADEDAATAEAALPAARAALEKNPSDAAALSAVGAAHAALGLDAWAARCFDQARAAGGTPPALTAARSYWRSREWDGARREFEAALQGHEAPEPYLRSCLAAVERAARPATQPATAPATTVPATGPTTTP